MILKRHILGALLVSIFLASCKTLQVKDIAGADSLMSGAKAIFRWQASGELPGIAPDEHGKLISVPIPETEVPRNKEILEAQFKLVVETRPTVTYLYSLRRQEGMPWTLVEAKEIAADGSTKKLVSGGE